MTLYKDLTVTLLGGSSSMIKYGLPYGIENNLKVTLHNLSLGATTSLQNVYAMVENVEILINSNLIITQSNVNDMHAAEVDVTPLDIVLKNIDILYYHLHLTNKKSLVTSFTT